jgi:hypothetical protein
MKKAHLRYVGEKASERSEDVTRHVQLCASVLCDDNRSHESSRRLFTPRSFCADGRRRGDNRAAIASNLSELATSYVRLVGLEATEVVGLIRLADNQRFAFTHGWFAGWLAGFSSDNCARRVVEGRRRKTEGKCEERRSDGHGEAFFCTGCCAADGNLMSVIYLELLVTGREQTHGIFRERYESDAWQSLSYPHPSATKTRRLRFAI